MPRGNWRAHCGACDELLLAAIELAVVLATVGGFLLFVGELANWPLHPWAGAPGVGG